MKRLLCVLSLIFACGCSGSKMEPMGISNESVFRSQEVTAKIIGIAQAKDFSVVQLIINNHTDKDLEFKTSYCELQSGNEKIYAYSDPETVLKFYNKGFKASYLIPYIGFAAAISDMNDASKDINEMVDKALNDRIVGRHDFIAGSLYFPPFENADKFITYLTDNGDRIKINIPLELRKKKKEAEEEETESSD